MWSLRALAVVPTVLQSATRSPVGGGGRVLHGFYLEQTLFPEIWGEVTVLEEHVARGSPPSCDRSNGGLGQL